MDQSNLAVTIAGEGFANVLKEGINAGNFVEITGEVTHYQTADLYGRLFKSAKNTAISTRVHKHDHISVLMKGHILVIDQDGNREELIAPCVFVTKAGTQRAIYVVEDFEFLTVHHHTNQNLDTVKDDLTCDTRQEYQQLMIEGEV